MKNKLKSLAITLCLLCYTLNIIAQTPGLIIEGTDPNGVLDPAPYKDGYVSLPPSQTPSQFTNIGFPPNINPTDINDILYSQIAYKPIPQAEVEPVGDLTKGPSCGFTDLVDDAGSNSSYYSIDGTANILFRFRLGDAKPNSKGYSVLIDTDEKFGFTGPNADPNAKVGNPGFEVEIVLRTNFSIDVRNIDNSNTGGTLVKSFPYTEHAIKSIALTRVCDDPDYFYDFYVPYDTQVQTVLTPASKIRMVTITSIAPKEAVGQNTTSDISGIDDSSGSKDNLFEEIINNQTPVDNTEDPVERADCPLITGSIIAGTGVTINGTNEFVSGSTTEIEIFIDGVSQGTPTNTTTNGTWSYTISGAITEGQEIKARATIKNGTTIIKGTSVDNCSVKTVSLTACTPPATPINVGVGASGGKDLEGTIANLNNQAVLIRIFNNGTEVTSWGNAATGANGYFTETIDNSGNWVISGGGGFKAPSGYYSVIIIPQSGASINCPSKVSNSISYCRTSGGGADGIESGTITLDTPSTILTSTSNISGVLGNTNATTVKLFKNNVFTGLTDISSGDTAWSIDISSLTLVSGDILYVSNKEDAATCTSISVNKTVQAKSLAPTLDEESCSVGNTTSVSGISSEANATIRLYTNASPMVAAIPGNLETPTTTVTNIDGSWTISGLNIPSGTYIVATAQNTGESESEISNEVQTSAKTEPTALAITSDPITEGDVSISGTIDAANGNYTIQLYLDGALIENKTTTITASAGSDIAWTISDLDNVISGLNFDELSSDAIVTVTATLSGGCESDPSSSKVVVCSPPTTPTIAAVTPSPICENGIFTVTIVDAQPGLIYQLLDQDNNTVGPSIVGPNPAADKTIDSDPIPFGTTSLKVRVTKIFGTCTSVESNAVSVTVNPSPTITFGANPFATFNASPQTVDLQYTLPSTNIPNQYKIDFDNASLAAENLGITSFTNFTSSPIVINIPASLPEGVYTATVIIKETTTPESCEKSYPINITILNPNAPTITLTNSSVSLCSGTTTAEFVYSATTNSPASYSVDFNDVANLQGFTDLTDVALPATPITISVPSSPNAGTYNGTIRLKTAGGIVSQEYPITISIEVTDPGIIGQNQIISTNENAATFTSIQDGSGVGGVTYLWQKSITSATAGFNTATGANTNSTYTDPDPLTQTAYYRRVATSVDNGCTTENTSNVITVTVLGFAGTPMITQVYQFGDERWIEITNIHPTDAVPTSSINVALFRDKTRVLEGTNPDAVFTLASNLPAGESVLFKNTNSVLGSVTGSLTTGSPLTNDNLTEIDGGNDIIILSTTTGATAWENRYDIVSSIENKTALVRIDETTATNKTYTESEWVTFIDDAIKVYGDQSATIDEGRHPHAPLVSEITGANTDANTRLGLHRINETTTNGGGWDNGFPDRSRRVVIDEDYNATVKLSARKLTVAANRKLGVNNLLVVTNDIILNTDGEIRLIDPNGNSTGQLVQTHQSASLVTGSGKLLVDQNSSVPSIYRYNYMGSPVKSSPGSSTYTIASVFKDGTNLITTDGIIENTATGIARDITFLPGLIYDGTFTESSISLADYWMYTYASSDGGRSDWVQKRSDGEIPNTDGFIFKGPGRPQNYTFLGTPKDGQITTSVGADQSYLVANPYASAISVKEFIEDNINAITGTLYFWKHSGEADVSGATSGHNYSGYDGGYATRTITTGVTAVRDSELGGASGPVDIILQAEDTNNVINGDISSASDNGDTINIVLLNSATDSITYFGTARSVDNLRLRYKSSTVKEITIKVNNIVKQTINLPATSEAFSTENISICILSSNNITIASNDNNPIEIDFLNLFDSDGEVQCTAGPGDASYQVPEAYIPIGQGFFVSGDTDGGIITFNNSQREYKIEGTGSSTFYRSSSKSNPNSSNNLPVIKLGMHFKNIDDGKTYQRQIAASFSSLTSFGYDKGYDAEMYDVGRTDFYWKFQNNEDKYVITGVQEVSNELEVPLEITIAYSGEITIGVDEIKNITQDVYITDKVDGISYKITNDKVNLTLDQGTYSNRFVLAFKSTGSLSVNDDIINTFTKIYVDNKNSYLNITKKQEIDIDNVQLFNLLGKQIVAWKIKEQKDNYQLKINRKLPTGVYIVKLNTDKGKSNKKVIIE